jgi:hypothetical protein
MSMRIALKVASAAFVGLVLGCRAPSQERACGRSAQLIPPALPFGCHGQRVERLGDTLLLFGGFHEDRSMERDRGGEQAWIYDLRTGQWQRVADMPRPRFFFGSAVFEGAAIAVSSSVDRYVAAEDRWEQLCEPEVFPNSHFGAAELDGKLYVLGGYPAKAGGFIGLDLRTREVIDPPEPPGFKPDDHFHIVVNCGGVIHAIGGLDSKNFQPISDHWVFDGAAWAAAPQPSVPLWAKFSAVQVVGSSIYIFESGPEGGRGWVYESRTESWRQLPGLRRLLAMPACVELNGLIYVLGGQVDSAPDTGVHVFDTRTEKWTSVEPVKSPG